MNALTKKFGQSRLVVDSVIGEMERMKTITNDKQFLDFVEMLEKICWDLEALKLEGEIANSTVIGKLESKLPVLVARDWTKKVIDKYLGEKPSKVVFKEFMTFLTKTRKQVEYQASETRQGSGQAQAMTSFVTGTTFLSQPDVMVVKSSKNEDTKKDDKGEKDKKSVSAANNGDKKDGGEETFSVFGLPRWGNQWNCHDASDVNMRSLEGSYSSTEGE